MKKLLLSVMTIALVAVVGVFVTRAYFSDTETSSDNFIQAGTIDIDVDGNNPWEAAAPWTMEDIKPSTTHYMTFTVNNVGENMVDVWKEIKDVVYTGGLHPESEELEDPGDSINNIGTVLHYDMYVNSDPLIKESDGYYVDGPNRVQGYWMYLGQIAPQGSMLVEQSYHMDSATTNWAQGDRMTFTVELYAQQVVGGATPPAGELLGYGKNMTPPLDSLDFGDAASEVGHVLSGWSNPWTWGGGYGGGDDGDFRLLMGPGDGCGPAFTSATFTMNASTENATKVALRHLDGQVDDSYDIFYSLDDVTYTKFGHYDQDGNPAETWVDTTFNLPVPVTGTVYFKLVSTDPVSSWCSSWGQVAFSQADLMK